MIALLWLMGCNQYDLFRVSGYEQETFANRADVLFVIDNSDSMKEESTSLAENFGTFVQRLAGANQDDGTEGLPDAVDRYVDYIQDPAAFADFQLAITTTDGLNDRGALMGPVLPKSEPNLADTFITQLMCEATCFSSRDQVPSDGGYTCGEPFNGTVSSDFLDCACGSAGWVGHCGAGTEMGLESVLLAMCRSVEEPPEICFDEFTELKNNEVGTNAGLMRPDTTLIPVVVTDEGDGSLRMANQDAVPSAYLEAFAAFDVHMSWAVIGPGLDEEYEVACPGLATSWGVLRYDLMVDQTGGLKIDIHNGSCGPQDFGQALDQLGELIGGKTSVFPLQSKPVEGSIVVEVGGKPVREAKEEGKDVFGYVVYGDGWSYRPEGNAVVLHGEAIPDYGQSVQVYYWPQRAK